MLHIGATIRYTCHVYTFITSISRSDTPMNLRGILKSIPILVYLSLSVGCGPAGEESLLKEAWNRKNDPAIMDIDYITKTQAYTADFSKLPLTGKLTQKPWSGDYWPTHKGGIAFRWNQKNGDPIGYPMLRYRNPDRNIVTKELSPAEKYDIITAGKARLPVVEINGRLKAYQIHEIKRLQQFYPDIQSKIKKVSFTRYERIRTNVLKTIPEHPKYDENYEIPTWEGLCHSWAPATILFQEPKPVTVKTKSGIVVDFGSSDLKALLTYFLHHTQAQTQFLGGRCNKDFSDLQSRKNAGEITAEEYKAEINSSECRDTNAGAFHIVLTNQIALMNQGFIVDITRDAEVWNQGVYQYNSQIEKERLIDATEVKAENAAPGTVKIVTVSTQMYYVNEVDHSWQGGDDPEAEAIKYYRYNLELNAKGEIIGGEWLTRKRPDFLWKQTLPKFARPFRALKKLYERSIR